MPDITMCESDLKNKKCNTCYRKNAEPNPYRQSYFKYYRDCSDNDFIYYISDERLRK